MEMGAMFRMPNNTPPLPLPQGEGRYAYRPRLVGKA
jgi:hypothetical protein